MNCGNQRPPILGAAW